MPGPLSSFDASCTSSTSVPGVKSNTTDAFAAPVAPVGLVATTLSTVVPPVIETLTLNAPLAPAVVVTVEVWNDVSMLVAAMETELPAADVPLTTTWPVATLEASTGELRAPREMSGRAFTVRVPSPIATCAGAWGSRED